MLSLQLLAVVMLLAIFIVASVWNINMGLLMFLGAAVIAFLGNVPADVIGASFPSDTFILIAGITYFFVVVESSGTMDYIVASLLRLVRGTIAVIPFLFFGLAAATTAIGAYPPAVAALVVPVAMRLAKDYGINRFLMAIMVIHGILAGNFGPLATPGVFTAKVLADADLEPITLQLFLSHLIVNALVAAVAYMAFGGMKLIRTKAVVEAKRELVTVGGGSSSGSAGIGGTDDALAGSASEGRVRPNNYQIATMASLLALVVLALGVGWDLGYTALALGLLLTLVFERKNNSFVAKMPWGVILMLAGVLVYFGVLTEIGAVDAISDLLAGMGSDLAAVLALSFLSGIISAFASSITTIGASLQLAMPLIGSDLNTLSVVGPVTISSTIVDASPIGIIGALSLASVEQEARPKLMRSMLMWAGAMIVLGPPLAWFALAVL
ncbi:SLC13 family permease [Arthrobacter koreensis]|uniref:SLC13 family permease n=1 Tax=Arthrobacter koreensis TaxID=199136 RepID=UPI002DB61F2D|nr:SLC13 family permease [Arthrobacter koreensis]